MEGEYENLKLQKFLPIKKKNYTRGCKGKLKGSKEGMARDDEEYPKKLHRLPIVVLDVWSVWCYDTHLLIGEMEMIRLFPFGSEIEWCDLAVHWR